MKYPKRSQYKHAKQKKYHVRNWAEYNEGLRRRGDLTVWFDEEAIANWMADKTGKPGGQRVYSDMAIETGLVVALLHGPEQIADLPVPVVESPGAVRIGHPERGHLVEYLAPNSVFNSLPRQRSCPHLGPDDRFVTIDRVLHHASLGAA